MAPNSVRPAKDDRVTKPDEESPSKSVQGNKKRLFLISMIILAVLTAIVVPTVVITQMSAKKELTGIRAENSSLKIAVTSDENKDVDTDLKTTTATTATTEVYTMRERPAPAALYVWKTGWDDTVYNCTHTQFVNWDLAATPQCYTGNWDNPVKRDWLWKTLNRPGREITTIFLSSIYQEMQTGYNTSTCSDSGIQQVKDTLIEGHTKVNGLKIYALFAVNDDNIGEREYVPWVVWYNSNCASEGNEKFDGFAVKNDKYTRSWNDSQIQDYLDKLNEVHTDATAAGLRTHYSVGWHWGVALGSGAGRIVNWNDSSANVTEHMVRIFDSVDIQVGFSTADDVIRRVYHASYGISRLLGKQVYFTLYTDKLYNTHCTTTFFPQPCGWGNKTEANMWAVADAVTAQLDHAAVSIQSYRRVYSSGGHKDWPAHRGRAEHPAGRSLYVYKTGWDNTVQGCNQTEFVAWNQSATPQCFTGNWDNPVKRDWLWKTLNRPDREITTIFLSSIHQTLQTGYNASICSDPGIQQVKDTLIEGHAKVNGLKIYALFAVNDINVGERDYVPWVVWYNSNCASGGNGKFDGFAVKNEKYSRYWDDSQIQSYLDKLNEVHTDATAAGLSTHYSVFWHWGRRTGGTQPERIVEWKGLSANVTEHMVRIFDSVDIQVGFTTADEVIYRFYLASYGISSLLGKPVYFDLYTDKLENTQILMPRKVPLTKDCTTTFFPQSCSWGDKTEAHMWAVADDVTAQLGDATVSINSYREVYSSGGHTDWPAHRT